MSLLAIMSVVRSYWRGKFDIVLASARSVVGISAISGAYCDSQNLKSNLAVGVEAVEPDLCVAEVLSVVGEEGGAVPTLSSGCSDLLLA